LATPGNEEWRKETGVGLAKSEEEEEEEEVEKEEEEEEKKFTWKYISQKKKDYRYNLTHRIDRV
jgi:hypothetical protein